MGQSDLRGDNRNDPIAETIAQDPGIQAVLDARRQTRDENAQEAVSDAIQGTKDATLVGWVAVAVWEDENGRVSHSVLGDGKSSSLELKGYLHDGLWHAAHTA